MTTGSCLCGAVRLRIEGPLSPIQICHCRSCQKAQGAGMAAVVPVATEQVAIESGAEDLTAFESSPGKERVFCRRCGSPVFSRRTGQSELRLRVGILDPSVDLTVASHAWCDEAPSWDADEDHAPRYPAARPG